ncbi:hypothetical protein K491DRAFT_397142 [Lophiostoma macrostomum CBS 122681]|uniref:Uncharacterized protein n=1 Tax=Lophiostoma macrostomum CBS 122681 TaxID=1314788 RepID=A0A6A6TBF1_9PLEO|nr:hypothetical protein K491DRAFT_397142 [Lophiostoma macrostomum CBS 122681]
MLQWNPPDAYLSGWRGRCLKLPILVVLDIASTCNIFGICFGNPGSIGRGRSCWIVWNRKAYLVWPEVNASEFQGRRHGREEFACSFPEGSEGIGRDGVGGTVSRLDRASPTRSTLSLAMENPCSPCMRTRRRCARIWSGSFKLTRILSSKRYAHGRTPALGG